MFVNSAYAADGDASATSGFAAFDFWSLVPMVLVIVVFYFLLIRPQQKKAKRHRVMLDGIKAGDKVTTAGGIIGTVTTAGDHVLHVELNKNNVVEVARETIARVHSEEKEHKPAKIKTKQATKASAKPPAKKVGSARKQTQK